MAGTGHSGRRPKATQNHVLTGTFRGDRHGDHSSPEPPKGRPVAPRELQGLALEEWERMVTRLEVSGYPCAVDDAAIFQYCCLFAETEANADRVSEYDAAIQLLEQNLSDLKGPDLVACFQEITKMHMLRSQNDSKVRSGRMGIRQWLVEFGLTPAARSRVKLPPAKPVSKVDQFRQQKQGA